MERSAFHTDDWYRAMTLAERSLAPPSPHTISDVAQRRIERWRSQFPFDTDGYFARRLEADNLSESTLLGLLSEPIQAVRERCPAKAAWLEELEEAFGSPELQPSGFGGFAGLTRPLIDRAYRRLQRHIDALLQRYPDAPLGANAAMVALVSLGGQLEPMLTRTMALELNVARLEGVLEGETSEERFRSFLARLKNPEHALVLLKEYPVLARQLTEAVQKWADTSADFLERLAMDWEQIKSRFSAGSDPGVLVRLAGGAGDRHRSGQTVQIAEFSSGFSIVYKPRSMAVDLHFQRLLAWINDRGTATPFRTLNLLDRGSYGWVEFIRRESCTSPAEIERFYQRQGGYLALLYILDAADFHQENLIAAGEHPVLLDLEAFFHPRFEERARDEAEIQVSALLNRSVLRTGLLPTRVWGSGHAEGIDLSGLSAGSEQLTPFSIPYAEGSGTDEMHISSKRMPMGNGHHRPLIGGSEVYARDHVKAILGGFTRVFRLLMQHHDELLAAGGPLSWFEQDEVRVILLPTNTYAILLRDSFHPDLLRDALDRDRFFDHLWAPAVHLPHLVRVIAAQRRDLENNDIPIFTTRPGSRDLWTSSGDCIAGFLEEPPVAAVRRRIEALDDSELAQQEWVIRAAFATLAKESERPRATRYPVREPESAPSHARMLKAACAAGDWLERHAWRGERDASWIGLTLGQDRCWSLAPLGTDLYDGLPGIAVFLAHLGAVAQDGRYTSLAQMAVASLRESLKRTRRNLVSIGGFSGWGGLVYSLASLGFLWNQPDLLDEADAALDHIEPLIERDEQLDVIGGAAGAIGGLAALYRIAPSDHILRVATRCGDHLLGRATPAGEGIGWLTLAAPSVPLTGFSHGAAGMAWALLKLAALTGESRFRDAAGRAIDYERGLFSPQHGNWPDLREGESNMFCMAWCHGAPGIGLARLSTLSGVDDPLARAEIDAALRTTAQAGLGGSHCLCHGDLGNLDPFLEASSRLNERYWKSTIDRLAASILASIDRDGWICGLPLDVRSPGLMTGVAGIGYQFLRLAEPRRVPSILTLGIAEPAR